MKRLSLAGCLIQDSEGRILLLHRNTPQRIQWEIPGGKIEPGEDPKKTAEREVLEELGIEVEIISEAGKHEFTEDEYAMNYIWFNAKIISGEPKPMEEKHDKTEYSSWNTLRKMTNDLSPNTKNLVAAYFSNQLKLSGN